MRNANGGDLAPPATDRGRLTERLRLEPVGRGHAEDLWRLHRHHAVAVWHGGRWTLEDAHRSKAAGLAGAALALYTVDRSEG